MSKSTRAQSSSASTAPTTLRDSARPLDTLGFEPDADDIPSHTAPYKAFDWVAADVSTMDPASTMLRELINDTINVCSGVSLALRMIEQCNSVADFSPELVTLSDGTSFEQADVPDLNPGDCAALGALAATATALLVDKAHGHANALRNWSKSRATRTGH